MLKEAAAGLYVYQGSFLVNLSTRMIKLLEAGPLQWKNG